MDTLQHKTCSKCHVSKPLDEFYDDAQGRYGKASYCIACKQRRDVARKDMAKVVPQEKACRACKSVKDIQEFGLDTYTNDGHTTRCKTCIQAFKDARAAMMKVAPEEKVCLRCHMPKPIDEFDKNSYTHDGYTTRCKACTQVYNAARVTQPKIVLEEKTCNKCDVTKPIEEFGLDKSTKDGHATRCLLCKCGESEDYRGKNPEKVRAATARWDAANPEKNKAWREKNKDKRSAQRKARYAADPTKENMQTAAYYLTKKDELRPKRRAWDQAHPEFTRAKSKRRRAQKAGSDLNDFTEQQWLELQEAQGHRCYYCKRLRKGKLTQDHLTPLSKGGLHTLHNVIAVCLSCNAKKGTKPPPVVVQPLLLTIAPSHKPKKKKDA